MIFPRTGNLLSFSPVTAFEHARAPAQIRPLSAKNERKRSRRRKNGGRKELIKTGKWTGAQVRTAGSKLNLGGACMHGRLLCVISALDGILNGNESGKW